MQRAAIEKGVYCVRVMETIRDELFDRPTLFEIKRKWEEFLSQIYEMLEGFEAGKESPAEKQWVEAMFRFQRSDDLLRYLRAARNDKTHGFGDTAALVAATYRAPMVVLQRYSQLAKPKPDFTTFAREQPETDVLPEAMHLRNILVPKFRKHPEHWVAVPVEHLGKPMMFDMRGATPAFLVLAACGYFKALLTEAQQFSMSQ